MYLNGAIISSSLHENNPLLKSFILDEYEDPNGLRRWVTLMILTRENWVTQFSFWIPEAKKEKIRYLKSFMGITKETKW